jgi:hypothetical protein
MRRVRRLACGLAAFLLIAPAGLRLAAPADAESEALRCAIACGHAAGAVAAGAACCPMNGAGATTAPAMASCPERETPGAIVLLPTPLAILAAASRPLAPAGDSLLTASPLAAPRDGIARAPEHVPILPS